MNGQRALRQGFTLIELMIVIAIMGVIAAVAIPTYGYFMKLSKTSEASSNLNSLFKGASAYYIAERGDQGADALVSGFCTIGNATPSPSTPRASKQKFQTNAEYIALGFTISDYVFYSYSVQSASAACGHAGSEENLYTFRAQGDLDGDTNFSTFELAVGSDGTNTLYHARGIFVSAEAE